MSSSRYVLAGAILSSLLIHLLIFYLLQKNTFKYSSDKAVPNPTKTFNVVFNHRDNKDDLRSVNEKNNNSLAQTKETKSSNTKRIKPSVKNKLSEPVIIGEKIERANQSASNVKPRIILNTESLFQQLNDELQTQALGNEKRGCQRLNTFKPQWDCKDHNQKLIDYLNENRADAPIPNFLAAYHREQSEIDKRCRNNQSETIDIVCIVRLVKKLLP